MPSAYSFMFPEHIRFGAGVARSTGELIRRWFWVNRVLVITDPGVADAGLLAPVAASLEASRIPYDVCAEVTPNPTDAFVEAMAARYRSDGHDLLVAVGGGSAIDAAKGIQVRITHPGHIRDYLEDGPSARKIIPNMPRLVAIPTTAGTGSEVTQVAVITDTARRLKKGIYAPYLRPALAVVDPELTLRMPPSLTAATGMDALTHCIEAYVSNAYGPIGKSVALGGMDLIRGALVRAFEQGDDLGARTDMAMAAVMGGLAFSSGCGLGTVHALAHQLSTEYDVPHGLANAILLPAVMAFNAAGDPAPFTRIAQTLGAATEGLDAPSAARAAVEAVRALCDRLRIPPSLRAVGVKPGRIPKMARQAMGDSCHRRNPRLCSEEDMAALYHAAL
jgi:alcohol dehydrogenase